MRSRRQLKITTLGRSSWMPYVPQGVKRLEDDEERRSIYIFFPVKRFE
jgi:hypothetical protein